MEEEKPDEPSDAEFLEMLKASGILNPNVTLDQLMQLSSKLNVPAQARAGAFIFREFVFRPC
jgi:hypothetical protein